MTLLHWDGSFLTKVDILLPPKGAVWTISGRSQKQVIRAGRCRQACAGFKNHDWVIQNAPLKLHNIILFPILVIFCQGGVDQDPGFDAQKHIPDPPPHTHTHPEGPFAQSALYKGSVARRRARIPPSPFDLICYAGRCTWIGNRCNILASLAQPAREAETGQPALNNYHASSLD